MKYSFYIVLILIILMSQKTFAVENNQDIIVKEENGIIYLIDNTTKSKKELVHGYNPLVSNNKTKFIYIPYSPSLFYGEVEPASRGNFYLYNITTKENKLLFIDDREDNFGYEAWSPYDRYIVFDAGTSNYRQKLIFDTIQKKFVVDFMTYDLMSPYEWRGEEKIIYWDSSEDLGSNTKIKKQKIIDMKTLQIQDFMIYEVDKKGHYKLIED